MFSVIYEWRRGWDSNPRAGYPTRRFRGAPVTTTSVPLHRGVRGPDGQPVVRETDPPLYRVVLTPHAARAEERLDQRAAFVLANAGVDLEAMIVGGECAVA